MLQKQDNDSTSFQVKATSECFRRGQKGRMSLNLKRLQSCVQGDWTLIIKSDLGEPRRVIPLHLHAAPLLCLPAVDPRGSSQLRIQRVRQDSWAPPYSFR
jgi:hypothetical protein